MISENAGDGSTAAAATRGSENHLNRGRGGSFRERHSREEIRKRRRRGKEERSGGGYWPKGIRKGAAAAKSCRGEGETMAAGFRRDREERKRN